MICFTKRSSPGSRSDVVATLNAPPARGYVPAWRYSGVNMTLEFEQKAGKAAAVLLGGARHQCLHMQGVRTLKWARTQMADAAP